MSSSSWRSRRARDDSTLRGSAAAPAVSPRRSALSCTPRAEVVVALLSSLGNWGIPQTPHWDVTVGANEACQSPPHSVPWSPARGGLSALSGRITAAQTSPFGIPLTSAASACDHDWPGARSIEPSWALPAGPLPLPTCRSWRAGCGRTSRMHSRRGGVSVIVQAKLTVC
jgi:hypothetical protein